MWFALTVFSDPQDKVFKFTQTSSIVDYLSDFEALANCIVGLPSLFLLSCFVLGLKFDIKREVFMGNDFTSPYV